MKVVPFLFDRVLPRPSGRSARWFVIGFAVFLLSSGLPAVLYAGQDAQSIGERRAISWLRDIQGGSGRGMQVRADSEMRSFGPKDADLVPTLVKHLDGDDWLLMSNITYALGKIGVGANGAVDELIKIYKRADSLDTKLDILWAMVNIQKPVDTKIGGE